MSLEVPVHAAHVPPNGLVLGEEVARRLADGGMSVGDVVETPGGPRTVVGVRAGSGLEAWSADGDSQTWRLSAGSRAAERLRVHRTATSVPDGAGYHPVHHTPLRGAPIPAAALDWLRSRGAAAMLEDVAWRQDHEGLARHAAELRASGERPGPPWRHLGEREELGVGPIRTGLSALAWVLGFDLDVTPQGVRLGLRRQEPAEEWSSGPIQTAGAFRQGAPVPGGMQDPELVGDREELRYAHVPLPWPMLPRHLAPWVAQLLGEPVDQLLGRIADEGTARVVEALAQQLGGEGAPTTLDGIPLKVSDFIWSEVPVVPGAFRRSTRHQGQRVPHGLDGALHALIAAVRNHAKLSPVPSELATELRTRIQRALDGYLTQGPEGDDQWGWSVAEDLQGILRVDGVMVDWGGQGVALVEPGRRRVGLPQALEALLLDPTDPEAVLLVRMPEGVVPVRPELVPGHLIRLPLDVAGALGARTGDLVRVVAAVSREAQQEIDALVTGVRLSPIVPRPGWLDQLAAVDPEDVGAALLGIARAQESDRCLGPVGSRLYAGIVATPRDDDSHEVERVQRAFALLLKAAEGPGHTMPPGVATQRVDEAEAELGRALLPEVRSLWTVLDGESRDEPPPLLVEGLKWRLRPLEPKAIRGGRIPLAEAPSGELLQVDLLGRVWRGDALVTHSLGRLLQVSFANRPRSAD